MPTVLECLDDERNGLFNALAELDEVQKKIADIDTDIFALQVNCINIWDEERVSFYLSSSDSQKSTPCGLATAFDVQHTEKEFSGSNEHIKFETEELAITTIRPIPRRKRNCKKYRVTQVLSLCGTPDESKYESIEEVTDADSVS